MDTKAQVRPVYASFGRRVAATVVDGALLYWLLRATGDLREHRLIPGLRLPWASGLLLLLLWILLAGAFESSSTQGTPGKMLFHLKVTDLRGERIDFRRALLRHVAELLSVLTLMVGYLMAAFSPRRQCLHDRLVGTLVVDRRYVPEQILQSAPAPSWSLWAVGACVVPLVVFWAVFLGVGSERGQGSSSSYNARTEVAAALYYASDAMDLAEQLYEQSRDFAEVNVDSVDLDAEAARTIESMTVVAGTVRIRFGGEADPILRGHTATLTPAVDEEGNIAWVCGYAAVPEGFVIVHDNYLSFTDVEAAALPPDCLSDAGQVPAPASGQGPGFTVRADDSPAATRSRRPVART